MENTEEFASFAAANGPRLYAAARCLSVQAPEDLVQEALVRLARHWRRVGREDPYGYCRQVMFRLAIDEGRRRERWLLRRHLVAEPGVSESEDGAITDRLDMLSRVHALPVGQRAVVLLRYWEGCSEQETAQILRCSVGNVKSQSSRAVTKLRVAMDKEEQACN